MLIVHSTSSQKSQTLASYLSQILLGCSLPHGSRVLDVSITLRIAIFIRVVMRPEVACRSQKDVALHFEIPSCIQQMLEGISVVVTE